MRHVGLLTCSLRNSPRAFCFTNPFYFSLVSISTKPSWPSRIPDVTDSRWTAVGSTIIKNAIGNDTGPEAFAEVMEARRQLEIIVQSCGYDYDVYPFGGVAIMRLLEVGGDVDFSAIADVNPTFEEASDIVTRWCREMKMFGMYCKVFPKARVPVIKAERTSHALPGSPLHSVSLWGIFQFSRPLIAEEQVTFMNIIADEYVAERCDWYPDYFVARVQFPDTSSLLVALTHFKKLGSVDICVRMPEDPKQGPELFRFPFDFCLSSSGLRNSYIFGKQVHNYRYTRHLILAFKRWGRSSGVVNSLEGMLASYALTVMLCHFLEKMNVLPIITASALEMEPHKPLKDISYSPLANTEGGDLAQLGYLFASFYEYFAYVFDYENEVVCTTNLSLRKNEIGWNENKEAFAPGNILKPPFYNFCIKDPFSAENIARNLTADAQQYVKNACAMATDSICKDIDDPAFLVSSICEHAPKPLRIISPDNLGTVLSNQQSADAYKMLKKVEFHRRRDNLQRFGQNTMRHNSQIKVAQDVTRSVVSWLKNDPIERGGGSAQWDKEEDWRKREVQGTRWG